MRVISGRLSNSYAQCVDKRRINSRCKLDSELSHIFDCKWRAKDHAFFEADKQLDSFKKSNFTFPENPKFMAAG